MAAGYGSPQAVTGSGYKEIQGKILETAKAGETDYNYTVRRMVLSIMIQRISRQSIL